MEALGPKIRRQRRRMGFTLDDLAARTGISKPYLSLIETGRVANPPSDEKLRKLEQTLEFTAGELITQAHLQRTPRDVRAVLQKLIETKGSGLKILGAGASSSSSKNGVPTSATATATLNPIDLDDAYLSGVLQDLVDRSAGNIEPVTKAPGTTGTTGTSAGRAGADGSAGAAGIAAGVPVINRVSAGYPRDFTDLSYPPRVADEYVSCPDLSDRDAFAARVHGDSMTPKYREGDIVIFSPAQSVRDGDDCFVRFADGHTTFKRVFFETAPAPDGKAAGTEVLRLQPRNEKYRPQTIASTKVMGLYKAMYRYQRVDDE